MGQGRGEEGKEEVKKATFPTLLTMIVDVVDVNQRKAATVFYINSDSMV